MARANPRCINEVRKKLLRKIEEGVMVCREGYEMTAEDGKIRIVRTPENIQKKIDERKKRK